MSVDALLPQERLVRTLRKELSKCSTFRVAIALVSTSGLDLLRPDIEKALRRGARGEFLFGIDLPTDPDAIQSLLALVRRFGSRFTVRWFVSPNCRSFHAKLWVFGGRSTKAVVGSSNLTGGGLDQNYEANVMVDGVPAERFASYFEELFDGAYASPVTKQWLAEYRKSWRARKENQDKARQLRDAAFTRAPRTPEPKKRPVPKRVKGHRFVFTGGIAKWPRERILYPYVLKLGGTVGRTAAAVATADALVQGEQLGDGETVKLRRARECDTPVITEKQFFALAKLRKN